jgi:hypothetical protein
VKYRVFLLGAALLASTACDLLKHSEPAAPVPSGVRYQMSGTILALPSTPLAGVTLTVMDGSDEGAHVSTDGAGHYAFASLSSGRFHMVISAPGYDSAFPVVDLIRDISVDFALHRTGT